MFFPVTAAAYGLGANFGWFIGLIISVLIIIALGILIYLMYKRRPEPKVHKPYTGKLFKEVLKMFDVLKLKKFSRQ